MEILFSVELEDIVQLETCVQLHADSEPDENKRKQPCSVTISLPEPSTQLINQISVVSEVRGFYSHPMFELKSHLLTPEMYDTNYSTFLTSFACNDI